MAQSPVAVAVCGYLHMHLSNLSQLVTRDTGRSTIRATSKLAEAQSQEAATETRSAPNLEMVASRSMQYDLP